MMQATADLSKRQVLCQSNHLLHLGSERPVFPADILHDGKKIAAGYAYAPYYERSSIETSCFVRISHFVLADAQTTVARIPEKKQIGRDPSLPPPPLLYSLDKATLGFLHHLGLTSGFFSKDSKGNIKEREMRNECLFYSQAHMVYELNERKIFTLVYGRIKEGGHRIKLLLNAPQPVSQEHASFSGSLGLVFTFNPPLGANIFDERKDNDYDLRVAQADALLKGNSIEADTVLFSKIQEANRFFAGLLGKIKTYFEKSGSAVAASEQPSVIYERVVTLSHDLES